MNLLLNHQEVELLNALNDCNVRYLIVGGHAVIFHGYLRPAKDLDIWVEPSAENAEALSLALSRVRINLSPEHVKRLAYPDLQMPINGGLNTELLTSVSGLTFENAVSQSVVAWAQNIQCPVVGLPDLIKSKRVLGREKDLQDVQQLDVIHGRAG